jgi:hypothetical protein
MKINHSKRTVPFAPTFTATLVAALCVVSFATAPAAHAQKKAGAKAKPAAGAAVAKLTTKEFPDGTGTIGLPEGWRFVESYRGTVKCISPARQLVTMGMGYVISRPDHPNHQFAREVGIPTSAPFARDGDLAGALRGVLEKSNNKLISLRSRPAPSGLPGVPAAYYLYELEAEGKRYMALGYFSAIITDDQTLPYWQLYVSVVMAPKESFMKDLPTLMAIWNSWRPNGQKPKPGSDGAMIDATIAGDLKRRRETLAEQQAAFDRMNEKFKQVIQQ